MFDNEQKEIVESIPSTSNSSQSTQLSSANDNNAKIGSSHGNQSRHPSVYTVEELYQRRRYNCIDLSIYSFERIICCHELLDGNAYDINDNWEFIKLKVHFINPTRNR